MNSRDFCFWMQGYIELTGSRYPTPAAWKLILEHLVLASEDEDYSRDEFEGVVHMFAGFVSIAGRKKPTQGQWKRIANVIKNVFLKVTSELDEEAEKENINDALDDALKELRKTQPYTPPPPYVPYTPSPWDTQRGPNDNWPLPPTIVCSTGDNPNEFDTITNSDAKPFCSTTIACSNYDNAAPKIIGDMYDAGLQIAGELGTNPLGYKDTF